jgi:hypothetical protein
VRFDERGEVVAYELAPSDEECSRGWQAMMLAKGLETCRALLRDESVPDERLCSDWVARFGRRR